MKKVTYTFSVANPCAESWLQMTPTEKGNFCLNCQKEVIDFSSMKDDEIIHVIKNAQGSVCGRFRNTQLNRPMHISYHHVQRPYPLRTILAGIVALTLLQPAITEASATSTKQELNTFKVSTLYPECLTLAPGDSTDVLRGRILAGFDSLSVAEAIVYMQGSPLAVTTDSTGRFTILIPDTLKGKKVTIEVIAIGLGKVYFDVTPEAISSQLEQVFYVNEMLYMSDGIVVMEVEEESPKEGKSKSISESSRVVLKLNKGIF